MQVPDQLLSRCRWVRARVLRQLLFYRAGILGLRTGHWGGRRPPDGKRGAGRQRPRRRALGRPGLRRRAMGRLGLRTGRERRRRLTHGFLLAGPHPPQDPGQQAPLARRRRGRRGERAHRLCSRGTFSSLAGQKILGRLQVRARAAQQHRPRAREGLSKGRFKRTDQFPSIAIRARRSLAVASNSFRRADSVLQFHHGAGGRKHFR